MSVITSISDAIIRHNAVHNAELSPITLYEEEFLKTFGECTIRGREWRTKGVRVLYIEMRQPGYARYKFNSELDIVHLHFNISGRTSISSAKSEKFVYGPGEHNIGCGRNFQGVMEYEGDLVQTLILQIDKNTFTEIVADTTLNRICFSDHILKDDPIRFFKHNLPISIAQRRIIDELINCPAQTQYKALYIYSKSIELLVDQVMAFEAADGKAYKHCKTPYDREKIMYAADYLLKHFQNPPSLQELSRIANLNEFKLKNGFKEVFNTTVHGYLTSYRMNCAQQELEKGTKNISDIAHELGYLSVNHFSNAFTKNIGLSPSLYRKKGISK
jgi:AraC-like DNA-binding protein